MALCFKTQVGLRHGCGRGGMVDTPDLKSVGRMPVGVRVPPPAPNTFRQESELNSKYSNERQVFPRNTDSLARSNYVLFGAPNYVDLPE